MAALIMLGPLTAVSFAAPADAARVQPSWCARGDLLRGAATADGRWMLVADSEQPVLHLLDADLNEISRYEIRSRDGRQASRVQAIYHAAVRNSFVVVLTDLPELWEISYDPAAAPQYDGLVHDYRTGEGMARPGQFAVRRIELTEPMYALWFDETYSFAASLVKDSNSGQATARVAHLDVRREIERLPVPVGAVSKGRMLLQLSGHSLQLRLGNTNPQALLPRLRERLCTP